MGIVLGGEGGEEDVERVCVVGREGVEREEGEKGVCVYSVVEEEGRKKRKVKRQREREREKQRRSFSACRQGLMHAHPQHIRPTNHPSSLYLHPLCKLPRLFDSLRPPRQHFAPSLTLPLHLLHLNHSLLILGCFPLTCTIPIHSTTHHGSLFSSHRLLKSAFFFLPLHLI